MSYPDDGLSAGLQDLFPQELAIKPPPGSPSMQPKSFSLTPLLIGGGILWFLLRRRR